MTQLIISDEFIQSTMTSQSNGARATDDVERGLYVLQVWQREGSSGNPYKALREYMVREEAVNWLGANILPKLGATVVVEEEKAEKRRDKYARLERMALDNVFAEYTTQDLVDASGLGPQTISKWAKTTGFYRPTGRGKWEARNPKEDREGEAK